MTLKNEIKNNWQDIFGDTREWIEGYFNEIYDDDDWLAITGENEIVSALSLPRYSMTYQGTTVPVGYIYGAFTRHGYRRKGYMGRLLNEALEKSFRRGDVFMNLIPASRELFFFYGRFGFATVFYIERQHYTSVHEFHSDIRYGVKESNDISSLFCYYNNRESYLVNRVMHSPKQFADVVWDNAVSGGRIFTAREADTLKGVAFAIPEGDGNAVVVKELLSDSEDVDIALLAGVRAAFPQLDIVVERRPVENPVHLDAQGMLRIVNVHGALRAVAREHKDITLTLKITDPLIEENNNIFHLSAGDVTVVNHRYGKIDSEIDVKVLAEVLFSTSATGSLFGLPSARPSMALMLD